MERKGSKPTINNAWYDDLKETWYEVEDHPIALLRQENKLRNPWIQSVLVKNFRHPCSVLDIGCGGGLLTNYLAQKGHLVTGIDLSEPSLEIARNFDTTKSVDYRRASAYQLPFQVNSFDAVCAMDIIEHVENPGLLIQEASRVLKKGGLFFFHTFNRNFWSYLLVIKGVDWCFSNAPAHMHVYPLFVKPGELEMFCENQKLNIQELKGVKISMNNKSFWKMVFSRKVDENFRFEFTRSLKTGYSGFAKKI
jgi:2-polyprenyl-6-hydroxyphenyl methylase/3-demethylubiquinone-9 3-methyltransferase